MLTLTENAQTVVDDLAARADLPEGGGLRISQSTTQPGGLELALTRGPQTSDRVIETGTTPVFVEPAASGQLDQLTLDTAASSAPGGDPAFVLAPQQD